MLHQNECGCGRSGGASFSILFPMSAEECGNPSVDCTLSLGTPSTRQVPHKPPGPINSCHVSSLCWGLIAGQHQSREVGGSPLGRDPMLLARRCANCDTTSTPLWRNGPRGPKSLCNACGIRYKKEERRAAVPSPSPVAEAGGHGYHRAPQSAWGCYAPPPAAPTYDELSWRLNVGSQPQLPARERTSLFQYQ